MWTGYWRSKAERLLRSAGGRTQQSLERRDADIESDPRTHVQRRFRRTKGSQPTQRHMALPISSARPNAPLTVTQPGGLNLPMASALALRDLRRSNGEK